VMYVRFLLDKAVVNLTRHRRDHATSSSMNFAFKLAVYQSSPMSLRQIQQRAVLFLAHKLQWFSTLDLTPAGCLFCRWHDH
jgi:hypothetical protein